MMGDLAAQDAYSDLGIPIGVPVEREPPPDPFGGAPPGWAMMISPQVHHEPQSTMWPDPNAQPKPKTLAPLETPHYAGMFNAAMPAFHRATDAASKFMVENAAIPNRVLPIAATTTLDPDEAEGAGGGRLLKNLVKPIGSLFDYSKVHSVPDVKQFDLPRYDPPRGVSERVEGLVKNKRVEQKMLDTIEQGKGINAETFYYNEPLRQAFIDELGKKEGQKGFARYMDYVAATSPRSDVESNARNASYYYGLERRGEPVPPKGGKNPEPYGHLAQNLHRLNAEKIRSGEYFDFINNPKPMSFSQNLQGNFAPVTVDAHALKLPAMLAKDPDFLATSVKLEKGVPSIYPSRMLESGEITMKDALKRPVYWASKPNANEYAAMEQYYKRLAGDFGMTPAQAQAAAWAGGGKLTGLESVAGDPFMRSVENRAIKTAAARGISPAEALSQMIRGKAPLLGVPAAAVMGGLAAQDSYAD